MKNLVLFAGILVAVSFASCGNKAEQAPAEEAETVAEQVCEAVDSCCQMADSCCQMADSCCQAAAEAVAE